MLLRWTGWQGLTSLGRLHLFAERVLRHAVHLQTSARLPRAYDQDTSCKQILSMKR